MRIIVRIRRGLRGRLRSGKRAGDAGGRRVPRDTPLLRAGGAGRLERCPLHTPPQTCRPVFFEFFDRRHPAASTEAIPYRLLLSILLKGQGTGDTVAEIASDGYTTRTWYRIEGRIVPSERELSPMAPMGEAEFRRSSLQTMPSATPSLPMPHFNTMQDKAFRHQIVARRHTVLSTTFWAAGAVSRSAQPHQPRGCWAAKRCRAPGRRGRHRR
jgi:hypothetical protein